MATVEVSARWTDGYDGAVAMPEWPRVSFKLVWVAAYAHDHDERYLRGLDLHGWR